MKHTIEKHLVNISDHGLLGVNYYWENRERYDLTEEEMVSAGVFDDRIFVHEDLIDPLKNADTKLQEKGFRLYLREGYRPKKLYELVYKKRAEKYKNVDDLLNMKDMPHATGRSVDAVLWNPMTQTREPMHEREDGSDALFVDFYKNKADEKSKRYQELQKLVIRIMKANGFVVGRLQEYFHFNFRP